MPHDQIIATRALTLEGRPEEDFIVTLFKPEPDDQDYRCEFEIDGKRNHAMGIDSAQALFLALQSIGIRLYTSSYYTSGKLTWLGRSDLGFPVAIDRADYLPKDNA